MLLIGSRAARFHFKDFRAAKDWDAIAFEREVAPLRARYAEVPSRGGSRKARFRFRGTVLEIDVADENPFLTAAMEESAGTLKDPDLGAWTVASPALLLVLKMTLVAFPVHWYKTLRDYHFLKARVPEIPPRLSELASVSAARDRAKFPSNVNDAGLRTESCSHGCAGTRDWGPHLRLHAAVADEAGGRGPPEVWRAAPNGTNAESLHALLRGEAMVLALEEKLLPAAAAHPGPADAASERRAFDWAMRVLITAFLPLRWRYFAADAYYLIRGGAKRGWSERALR